MKYKEVTLGEICDVQWGDTSTTKAKYTKDGFKAYSASSNDGFLPYFDYDREGIVLSAIGAACGKFWYASGKWSCIKNTIRLWSNDEAIVLTKYLYYAIDPHNWIISGSAQPFITLANARSYKLKVPDLETQQKVVRILSALDEKIELNNKSSLILENIMKSLFKDWISSFTVEKKTNLAEIATYLNGLAMQKYRPQTVNRLPVIKIKEINSGFSSDTETCNPDLIGEKYIVHDGDVLFAWSGTLCAKIWCGGDGGLNQHIFKVTSEKYPKWFYYFWTLEHLEKFIQIAKGKATTMGHIKRNELSLSEVLVPSEPELERFGKIMSPMLDKYIANNIENRRLASIRDSLLPKLISGEINLDKVTV